MKLRIEFVKEDCWIGVYWKRTVSKYPGNQRWKEVTKFYVCIVPCFPIIFTRTRRYTQ